MLLLNTIRFDWSQELVSLLLELFSDRASSCTDPDSATDDWLESMPSQLVGGRKLKFSSSIVVFSIIIAFTTFAIEIKLFSIFLSHIWAIKFLNKTGVAPVRRVILNDQIKYLNGYQFRVWWLSWYRRCLTRCQLVARPTTSALFLRPAEADGPRGQGLDPPPRDGRLF